LPATLLVEADGAAADGLHNLLLAGGHTVFLARDGMEALRLFYENDFDVALIGAPVQKLDSTELVRLLRTLSRIPILVLVHRRDPAFVIRMLEAGADDVLASSAPGEEVLARIRASSRRANHRPDAPEDQAVIETGDLVIDRAGRRVAKRGQSVPLSQTEYRLLEALAARAGHVAPHRFLLSTVWGEAFVDDKHYLRMYIGYLRAKLEDDASHPEYLQNEWGTGYRLALVPPRRVAREAGEGAAALHGDDADLVTVELGMRRGSGEPTLVGRQDGSPLTLA
jgi:two-component system KDP operon response regulator KdpE